MRNFFSELKQQAGALALALSVAVVGALSFVGAPVMQAHASVPAAVEGIFTGASTDFGTVQGYGWTAFIVIVGGLVLFGLVRKVVGRAVGR